MTDIDADAQGEQLHRLFTELADDPEAPPSTVSPLSVIAVAKRAGVAQSTSTEVALRPSATVAEVSSTDVEPMSSVGERHLLAVHADAEQTRRGRRRTGLLALAVAASLAGIAALVIPITLSGGSSTSTSADAARDSAATVAASGEEGAAALAAEAPAVDSGTAQAGSEAGAADAAGAAPEGAAGGAESQVAGSERPAPGPDALTESVPAEGAQPSEPVTTEVVQTCWPALSEQAAAALSGALPAGAFGPPMPLDADCGANPVGGAMLVGTAPATALEVRVSQAELGACTRGAGEAGVRCVPRGESLYVATDGGGQPTAFAYGNGNEVVVGGPAAVGGVAASVSGLTADQLVAAAQAVLGALG